MHRPVHEAGAPGPVVLGLRFGEHRHVAEVRVLARPLLGERRAGRGRSAAARPSRAPSGGSSPMWNACSMMRLDRRETGAARRRRSSAWRCPRAGRTCRAGPRSAGCRFSFISLEHVVAERRRRSCARAAREPSSCGAFAIEKLRRLPSFMRMSMYWPARNCRRSLAGSFSRCTTSRRARRSIFSHAAGQLANRDVLRPRSISRTR